MKPAHTLGIIAALLAAVLWFMGRWTHEILRCLGGVSGGSRRIEDCTTILAAPSVVFSLWLPLIFVSAIWGVYLLFRGQRWLGLATLLAALAVFALAGSFM